MCVRPSMARSSLAYYIIQPPTAGGNVHPSPRWNAPVHPKRRADRLPPNSIDPRSSVGRRRGLGIDWRPLTFLIERACLKSIQERTKIDRTARAFHTLLGMGRPPRSHSPVTCSPHTAWAIGGWRSRCDTYLKWYVPHSQFHAASSRARAHSQCIEQAGFAGPSIDD